MRLSWQRERPLRSVFMGTPAFAVPSLETLAAETTLVGVVSQPDRPRGRGLELQASPISRAAARLAVPLIRPARIRAPEVHAALAAWRPDLLVVAAYGRILQRAILDLASLAAINVHASLLPRHRGAAPIAAAILAGDAETGVTIMLMSEEMDAGDVLLQRTTAIAPDDTTATLTERLARLGGEALHDTLAALRAGGLEGVAQDARLVTYAPRLRKDDGRIRWSEPAVLIERKVRAFTPWPNAFTGLGGRRVKVAQARLVTAAASGQPATAPGTIVAVGESLRVATGSGSIDLLSLQLEGRQVLAAPAFAAGARLRLGARFDD